MNSEGAPTDAAMVDAVLAVDDVVAIVDDPDGPDHLDGPDASDPTPAKSDRDTVTDAHDPTITAHNVQDAVHRVTGGRVDVTIEEILER